jgi:hypothetical protein
MALEASGTLRFSFGRDVANSSRELRHTLATPAGGRVRTIGSTSVRVRCHAYVDLVRRVEAARAGSPSDLSTRR